MQLTNGPLDASRVFVFAHGAGAAMDSPFMDEIAEGLAARGIRVVRFEFPYMARARAGERRSAPERMPTLESCFREVVAQLGEASALFIGGKSMGGRVATRVADELGVRGVVALGYPFHPPKQPLKLRTEHLASLRAPCLIVQGTRDPFGTREEVERYALSPSIALHWLQDGDHSFEPRKASGLTTAQNLAEAIEAVAQFMVRT